MQFQALLEPRDDGGVSVRVLLDGKPLSGAKVQLFCEEGHEEGSDKTNDLGEIAFSGKQVESGLNGLLVAYVDTDAHGEVDGESYKGEAHYLSVTFHK